MTPQPTVSVIEIQPIAAPPPKDPSDWIAGVTYAKNWTDFPAMGFACGIILTTQLVPGDNSRDTVDRFRNPRDLAERLTCGSSVYVCGFNSTEFAEPLMTALGNPIAPTVDLLSMIVGQCEPYGSRYWSSGRSYNLKSLCQANGLASPMSIHDRSQFWQCGNEDLVIEDCASTALSIARILQRLNADQLINPNTGDVIEITL